MVILDKKTDEVGGEVDFSEAQSQGSPAEVSQDSSDEKKSVKKGSKKEETKAEEVSEEDIPF